jgi:hypothetical protein
MQGPCLRRRSEGLARSMRKTEGKHHEDTARAEGNFDLIREAYATSASFYDCILAAPRELQTRSIVEDSTY